MKESIVRIAWSTAGGLLTVLLFILTFWLAIFLDRYGASQLAAPLLLIGVFSVLIVIAGLMNVTP